MKDKIKDIFTNGSLQIYLIVKNGEVRKLKFLNAHSSVAEKIQSLLCYSMDDFISKLDDVKDIKDAYDGTNSIYKLDSNIFDPFNFFEENRDLFTKNDIPDGFAMLVGYDDKKMWIYQNIYQNAIIKSKNKVSITYNSDSCDVIDKDLISFEKRIDAIKINNQCLISNYKIIEKKFNYKDLIRKISSEVIQTIKELNIVDDIEKIQECAGEDQITFAKKLMRAKDSPVFSLSKEKLMLNVKNSKAYTKLINNDEFVIDTKDKARKFVGMLNDQLLVSELTGEIYDASVKKKIND